MALQRITCQCQLLSRNLWTTVPKWKKDKEWQRIERDKNLKYDRRLKKIRENNPFQTNVGLKHQVSKNIVFSMLCSF